MLVIHHRGVLLISMLAAVAARASEDMETPAQERQVRQQVTQTNLVSDQEGKAAHTDPNLVNPWEIAFGPRSFFWITNNGTGTSTVYDGDGVAAPKASPIIVAVPAPAGSPTSATAAPTGLVFNGTAGFTVGPGGTGPGTFLFATEDGTISGWNNATDPKRAIVTVDRSASSAVYKGLAIVEAGERSLLYSTNFHDGTVDVFDAHFKPVTASTGTNAFADPDIPAGFAPFGVHVLEGHLFVTYAKQDADKKDDVKGAGNGFIDEFAPDGTLLRRFASRGALDSPWAVTLAPPGFGAVGGMVLVGNFGDGKIHAFDLVTGAMRGTLTDASGGDLVIDGLWTIVVGNGANAGDATKLYFVAGPDDERHGLFGSLAVTR